ncbi:MAG: helix-turn-helix transcriptional regulator [Gammaproteobacteria bacterium]
MSQTRQLVQTLKKVLKSQGFTYKDVAHGLGISEASVKRTFAMESMSLERLEQICLMVGKEIADLVYQMDIEQRKIYELTLAQETELVNDPKCLLVAHLVLNGWEFSDILEYYYFEETELTQHLVKLDNLGLLELLPLNRIKLRISPHFSWRRDGPIQQFHFAEPDEKLRIMAGMLTDESAKVMNDKFEELTLLFSELYRKDREVPVEKRKNYGAVLSIRPWLVPLFNTIRK